ncbi:hypothetical protein EVAR_20285_1 [Eumeta japonica]|uniref:Uncharacterized protein n=1 Tax=Eumeta variegata TaxID=151549 RepID=A0A4C1VQN0_EUMVA|nr:hypothetical protein EVAR_20285_1 [Eumeta japonica]
MDRLDRRDTTLSGYTRELIAYAIAFRPVSESSSRPLLSSPSHSLLHRPTSAFISYPIPIKKIVNALVTSLGLCLRGAVIRLPVDSVPNSFWASVECLRSKLFELTQKGWLKVCLRKVQRTKFYRSELAANDYAQVLRSLALPSSPPRSYFTPLRCFRDELHSGEVSRGRQNLEDDPRAGWPAEAPSREIIGKVEKIIRKDGPREGQTDS